MAIFGERIDFKRSSLMALILVGSCGFGLVRPVTVARADSSTLGFTFAEPEKTQIERRLKVGITRYWLYMAKDGVAGGVALRGTNAGLLGPVVSVKDFCLGAHEGTIVVPSGRFRGTYNIEAFTADPQTDCKPIFRRQLADRSGFISVVHKTERAVFTRTSAAFGLGVRDMPLHPYRSIAVDPNVIPIGTVVFLPSVRGRRLILPDGRKFTHDGYFMAVDVGTDIRGQRIDIFQGVPARFARDTLDDLQDEKQDIWLMNVPDIHRLLRRLHRLVQQ